MPLQRPKGHARGSAVGAEGVSEIIEAHSLREVSLARLLERESSPYSGTLGFGEPPKLGLDLGARQPVAATGELRPDPVLDPLAARVPLCRTRSLHPWSRDACRAIPHRMSAVTALGVRHRTLAPRNPPPSAPF